MDEKDRQLLESEEERQRREHWSRLERQALDDLNKIMRRPEGQRVMRDILKGLGVGRTLSESDVSLFNYGVTLLSRMGKASPERAARILACLFEVGEL